MSATRCALRGRPLPDTLIPGCCGRGYSSAQNAHPPTAVHSKYRSMSPEEKDHLRHKLLDLVAEEDSQASSLLRCVMHLHAHKLSKLNIGHVCSASQWRRWQADCMTFTLSPGRRTELAQADPIDTVTNICLVCADRPADRADIRQGCAAGLPRRLAVALQRPAGAPGGWASHGVPASMNTYNVCYLALGRRSMQHCACHPAAS